MYVFLTTRLASRKSNIRVPHHSFSTSPNQPDLSISLRTSDRPGIARPRRWSIGIVLARTFLSCIEYRVRLMRLRDGSLEMSRFAECGGSTVECFAVQAHEHPICAGESALVVLQDGITLVNSSIIVEDPRADGHTPP